MGTPSIQTSGINYVTMSGGSFFFNHASAGLNVILQDVLLVFVLTKSAVPHV